MKHVDKEIKRQHIYAIKSYVVYIKVATAQKSKHARMGQTYITRA